MIKEYLWVDVYGSLEIGDLMIIGTENKLDDFPLASIRDLELDIERQKRMLKYYAHPDGRVCPWGERGEILILQEGEYMWNNRELEYKKIDL